MDLSTLTDAQQKICVQNYDISQGQRRMPEQTFDVWSGTPERHRRWLETVAGLASARKRMKELARETPGQYFIFSVWNSCVLDQIATEAEPLGALDREAGQRCYAIEKQLKGA